MKVLDLFSGAGGLTLGFMRAGMEICAASDYWQPAADTHKCNFKNINFLMADIRDLEIEDIKRVSGGTIDVVSGGPPCQGFSSAGSRNVGDKRNSLVSYFAKKAVEINPKFIIFENVEGFLTAESGKYVIDLFDPLIEAGYVIRLQKINVANFGVPQSRKRVIVIAAKGIIPHRLTPTHSANGTPGIWREGRGLPSTKTVNDILSGFYPDAKDPLSLIKPLSELDHRRISALQQGQTMKNLEPALQHASFRRRASRRVQDGTPSEKRGGAPSGIRRLKGDEPSKAITSAASSEFIHPDEDRMLTLREAALIQTFPSSYAFVGTRREIATMIGNAIPPQFAFSLAETIKLSEKDSVLIDNLKIVDFDVSKSGAMSPALRRTVEQVYDRYGKIDRELKLF